MSKNNWIIIGSFLMLISCASAQSKQSNSDNFKTFDSVVKDYKGGVFLVKDSLDISFGDKEGVLISLVNENERELEFKDLNDAPVKRKLLILEKYDNDFMKVLFTENALPSLGFGERSDIGYTNLIVKGDIISFAVIKLPYKSNIEYEFAYYFKYYVEGETWFLYKCTIEKLKPDDTIESYELTSEKFGKLSIKEFNIYKFNPFVYL